MCTRPVCLIGSFASGNDLETTGPVGIVYRQRSDHGTCLFHTWKRRTCVDHSWRELVFLFSLTHNPQKTPWVVLQLSLWPFPLSRGGECFKRETSPAPPNLLPHTHTKVKAQLDSAVSDVLLVENTCACRAISTTSTEWGGATVSVVPKFVGGNSMKNPTPPV